MDGEAHESGRGGLGKDLCFIKERDRGGRGTKRGGWIEIMWIDAVVNGCKKRERVKPTCYEAK